MIVNIFKENIRIEKTLEINYKLDFYPNVIYCF